jgi:hypothetical protein
VPRAFLRSRLCVLDGWPCGLMDKALVFGTKDCRFESCQGHILCCGARVCVCVCVCACVVAGSTHRGARTHDHKVKGLALCRLS